MQFHWFSTSHTIFLKISGPHSLVEIHKELKLSLITCLEISCICHLKFYVTSFSTHFLSISRVGSHCKTSVLGNQLHLSPRVLCDVIFKNC